MSTRIKTAIGFVLASALIILFFSRIFPKNLKGNTGIEKVEIIFDVTKIVHKTMKDVEDVF